MADKPEQFNQCRLIRSEGSARYTQIAWISVHGAKVGFKVELLPSKKVWEVAEVYADTGQDADYLHEREKVRRKGLPSIRDTKKDKKRD